MRIKLLQHGRLMGSLEKRLEAGYDIQRLPAGADRDAFLAERGREFTGLVTSAGTGADAALIGALPVLKVISSMGVGLDKIDLAAAHRRGVPVGYTPDVLNDCVADLAVGLMIDVMRGISASDRYVRRGDWAARGAYPLQRKVSGRKLGILGLGRIGAAIARRAMAFEMEIRYTNRNPVPGVPWVHEPQLLELARWCDCLIVMAAGGAATQHLVNASVLDALGPEGFIVNVARGSVIDQPALVRALVGRRIAGAALDVFDNEPNVPSELFGLDNAVLVSHIGSATHETREAMAQRVLDNLSAWFERGALVSAAPAD